jgi:hypothetical protein
MLTDGANARTLWDGTLLPGEQVNWGPGSGWVVFDSLGRPKVQATPAQSGNASVAAQAGFAADTYVSGSNLALGTGRLQAGSYFQWNLALSKTAAGVATPTFILRFGTAGAVADTARVTFTGSAQSAVADVGFLVIQAAVRTYSSSGVLQGDLSLFHQLAATGFATTNSIAGNYFLSTTSGAFDITVPNSFIGLSINGGASAAWTITSCIMVAGNLTY